jgi:hypothetical protein
MMAQSLRPTQRLLMSAIDVPHRTAWSTDPRGCHDIPTGQREAVESRRYHATLQLPIPIESQGKRSRDG